MNTFPQHNSTIDNSLNFNSTIVTCLFNAKNKYDKSDCKSDTNSDKKSQDSKKSVYKSWSKTFYKNNHTTPMIIYTDDYYYDMVCEYRKDFMDRTIIRKIDFTEFRSYQWIDTFNDQYNRMDPEKHIHSVDLYLIWAEKSEFMRKSAMENPFQSEFFIWMDSGMIRDKRLGMILHNFPDIRGIRSIINETNPSVCLLEMSSEWRSRIEIDNEFIMKNDQYVRSNIHIGGTTFFGNREGILKWGDDYYSMLDEYKKRNFFIGKDQNVMVNVLVKHSYVHSLPVTHFRSWVNAYQSNPWFFLLNCLSTPIHPTILIPILQGGLGNQMFQAAAAYGLAKRLSKESGDSCRYMMGLHKKAYVSNAHSKNGYYDNVLSSFPYCNIERIYATEISEDLYIRDENHISNMIQRIKTLYSPDIMNGVSGYFDHKKQNILRGYFQDYRYFNEYRRDILDMFDDSEWISEHLAKHPMNTMIKSCLDHICPSAYYFHIRFGDFESRYLHNINQIPFYREALKDLIFHQGIRQFSEYDKEPINFLVSVYDFNENREKMFKFIHDICNDIIPANYYRVCTMEESAKKYCPVNFIIDLCRLDDEIITFHLFKKCYNGGIGPHSTFSWWAGYLNENPTKRIYIPNRWINIFDSYSDGYFYPNTIRLSYTENRNTFNHQNMSIVELIKHIQIDPNYGIITPDGPMKHDDQVRVFKEMQANNVQMPEWFVKTMNDVIIPNRF